MRYYCSAIVTVCTSTNIVTYLLVLVTINFFLIVNFFEIND